jgi:hypothetical protein
VGLHATPAAGSRFVRWLGACAGANPSCRVDVRTASSVTAVFAPARQTAAVAVAMDRPVFRVRWSRSVGTGTLVVRGRISKPAVLRMQLRRPGGGPLLTQVLTVPAGRFALAPRLAPGLLAPGAHLFPGGFVVSLAGRIGRLPVPLQLSTIFLRPPAEGVVRRAFASRSAAAVPVVSVPAGSTTAWAHFVFEAQPVRGKRVKVVWYRSNGTPIGEVRKANRPKVVSWIEGTGPLPSDSYRAELWAGGRLVKALNVIVR